MAMRCFMTLLMVVLATGVVAAAFDTSGRLELQG